ncbi:MAG: succinate dehydrogenase assembly factor 2 [Burkholderiaceae bacterium]|nr:succinate dehydrogenase assembly factor 2 [Burkholderiaceae bacterium]MDO9089357.1 succinate dehydrogenase assembly factor 2 [Burkholderiaceae bacterium]MDP1968691.1 succinate dehydrogenase assembly factor 2 [Burkholderiaceae bacterium]
MTSAPLDERALSKLQWRCRRGLLENDLFIQKFFGRHGQALTEAHAKGLNELMDLPDNDLLDLLLRRKELQDEIDNKETRLVLELLRNPQAARH